MIRTWYLAKAASQFCSFIYGEMGWAELFAGKIRYFESHKKHLHSPNFAYRLSQMPEKIRNQLILPLFRLFQGKNFWRMIRNIDFNQEYMNYLLDIFLFENKERKKASPLLYYKFDPEIFTHRFHKLTTIKGKFDPFLYFDAKTSLPDSVLTQYERLFAPFSLKLIAPFLDHRLVQFMASVPESIKGEKEIPGVMLRHHLNKLGAYSPEFPETEDPFINQWKNLDEFRTIFKTLERGLLAEEGMISPKWIRQQLGYPYLIPSTFKQLWALLTLEIWFRLYVNKPITESDLDVSVFNFLNYS